jgi:sec-independent protein translocase protein TatA
MSLGFTEILLILLAIVILFGLGKLPKAMGDIGKGIHAFKSGLRDAEREELAKEKEKKGDGTAA